MSTKETNSASRIGIFNPALPGGGEKVLLRLAEGFLDSGHPVDMVLGEARGPYMSQVNPAIRVIDLQAITPVAKLRALIRYLRSEAPALLITADDFVNVAWFAKWISGVPTIIAAGVHNTMSELFKTQHGWRATLRHIVFPRVIRMADYIVPVSHCAAADIAAMAHIRPERMRVIYNAVLNDQLWAMGREPVEHPFFRPGEPPVLLSIGRLAPQKDFATLIRGFALLRATTRARLLIFGEGEQRAGLEALVGRLGLSNDVALPGFIDNPYAYIARSAAFVSSSLFEGLPTVLIEALALGTPVVATNCLGSAEVLENGKWGRLTPPQNPAALAQAILQTLTDRTLPNGLEQSLWQRFATPNITAAFLALLPGADPHRLEQANTLPRHCSHG